MPLDREALERAVVDLDLVAQSVEPFETDDERLVFHLVMAATDSVRAALMLLDRGDTWPADTAAPPGQEAPGFTTPAIVVPPRPRRASFGLRNDGDHHPRIMEPTELTSGMRQYWGRLQQTEAREHHGRWVVLRGWHDGRWFALRWTGTRLSGVEASVQAGGDLQWRHWQGGDLTPTRIARALVLNEAGPTRDWLLEDIARVEAQTS
jgi:hypothetical protein